MTYRMPPLLSLLPLAAIPLAMLLLLSFPPVIASPNNSFHVGESLFEVLHDWLAPPFLVLTLLASLHACRVVAISLRDRAVPAPLALLPSLIPAALAFGLVDHQLRGLLKATTHCGPLAWERVLVLQSGEFLLLRAAALLLAGCSALCVAIALLPTARGPNGAARLGFLSSIAAVAVCFLVSANASMGARAALITTALADSVEPSGLVPAIERWQRASQSSNTLLLWALVLGIGAALRLASRGEGHAGVGGLVTLAIAGVVHHSAGRLEQRYVQRTLAESYYFDSHRARGGTLPLKSSASTIRGWRPANLGFSLDATDRSAELATALAASRAAGARTVSLSRQLEAITVPVIFGPAALLRATQLESVTIVLRFDDEPACPMSAADVDAARTPTPVWALPPRLPPPSQCVNMGAVNQLVPMTLLTDASAAVATGRWPVVSVARESKAP